MSVSIKTTITRTLPTPTTYNVAFAVIDNVGITPEVFVFDAEHDTYSHVAGVYDMSTWPTSRATAQAQSLEFYRANAAACTFSTVKDATGFETVTRNRLKILATAWNSVSASYPGSDVYTATS